MLRLLDQTWPAWRARLRWQRGSVRVHCTGAVDLPGTTWHDRPAIDRGQELKVATDQSAAPGLLAETGVAAAQLAVQQLSLNPPRKLRRGAARRRERCPLTRDDGSC